MPAATMWGAGALCFGLVDLILFCYPLVSDSLIPAFVCMIVVGLPGAFTVAGLMTTLQQLSTDGTRGRVFGAIMAAEGAAVLLGITGAVILSRRQVLRAAVPLPV